MLEKIIKIFRKILINNKNNYHRMYKAMEHMTFVSSSLHHEELGSAMLSLRHDIRLSGR